MTHRGAIACGHPVTADAAEEILVDGGNAFDAAIAAHFAACVAEPVLASLGGGGFLLAHPASGSPRIYDFFAQTPKTRLPRQATDFYPIHADFGTTTQEFHIGVGAIATPGCVRGMFEIHRDLGTLPMTRLLAPAIRAARDGVWVNALQADIFRIVAPIYSATPEARSIYGAVGEGTRLIQTELADTLTALAREGQTLFYQGELAEKIITLSAERGGHLTREDLTAYQVIKRQPLRLTYRNARVFTNPPPSAGGILIGFALELLRDFPFQDAGFGTSMHLTTLLDVMHLTSQARVDVLAAATSDHPLDTGLLKRYRTELLEAPRFNRGTTHISVVDKHGNIAALSLSNGEGCGELIPGSGVMLNNMLGEEDINPTGFGAWTTDTRMASMMAPTLVEPSPDRRLAMGSGGSNRIRTAILQVICNLLDFGDDPRTAVARPRVHFERETLSAERGYDAEMLDALETSVHETHRWEGQNLFFGGVHVVEQRGKKFAAAGDGRRGGVGRVV